MTEEECTAGACKAKSARTEVDVYQRLKQMMQQALGGSYHRVVLLQDLHILDQLVLLLSYPLVMHSVEVPLLTELVPCCRCLRQQAGDDDLLGA